MAPMTPHIVDSGSPAYEQVADHLRDLIIKGKLTPGEKLPVEAGLTRQFGVSRSTVREALRVLSSQHLVTTTRGASGGTFVAVPANTDVSDYLENSISMWSRANSVTVHELLEARRLLEVPACRMAAERSTPSLVAELEGLSDAVRGPDFEVHREFHAAILRASGNRLLEILTAPLFNVMQNRLVSGRAGDNFWKLVANDHREIIAALAAHDADLAEAAMAGHIANLAGTYLKMDRQHRQQHEVTES